jgi:2-polyprenyl-6-methoxyphenol hydroxylase-like FAD-dependent oxidoreductase
MLMVRHTWLFQAEPHLPAESLLALSPLGAGSPVQLFLKTKVIDMDVSKATLTLEDGRVFRGDLVLGADGVHVCNPFH